MKVNAWLRRFFVSSTMIWFSIMVFLPIALMFFVSVSKTGSAGEGLHVWDMTHYRELFQSVYARIVWQSVFFSSMTTCLCLLFGYPVALAISNAPSRWKPLYLMFLLIPFWSSSLVRIYALLTLLKAKGLINSLLLHLGVVHLPLALLYNNIAVVVGQVYTLLPFMILPLYALLDQRDPSWEEAAKDLGASEWQILRRVIWPYSLPAVASGVLCVFLPAMTLFYIPDLLGGRSSIILGNVIQEQIMNQDNWPGGAATSMVLTAILLVLVFVYQYLFKRKKGVRV